MEGNVYLKNAIVINKLEKLQPDYEGGTLVLTYSQAVVDECIKRAIPVAGIQAEDGTWPSCQQIILEVDQVEDEDLPF